VNVSGLDEIVADLERELPGRVTRDASSAALTTYRCGGALAALVRAEHDDDLATVATIVQRRDVPVLVVGRGSNLLVADEGFRGIGVLLGGVYDELHIDSASGRVDGGGAVALPVLARRAAGAGVGGLEFYVGIPGSVGGAVKMNAGGHGAQTDEVLVEARTFDLDRGTSAVVPPAGLGLGYRTSGLEARAAVVGAVFQGEPDDPRASAARIEEIVRWRREHQPGGQNAGSVFTNPPGDAAGRLIDVTGCKGMRVGGAVVSEKHANFFVAEAGATARDVFSLICQVRRRVADATGVQLEPELRLVGFDVEEVQR
jgi:UDP-N-acetylmuramate dehydrogenase